MKEVVYDSLTDIQKIAIYEAEKARERAYNPYSNFFVGACLYNHIAQKVVSGANFENASYGLTVCAERSAVFRANAEGQRCFHGIVITTRGLDFDIKEPTPPCGACRQVLNEIAQLSNCDLVVVLVSTKRDKIFLTTIKELLPGAFGPADLGIELSRYR